MHDAALRVTNLSVTYHDGHRDVRAVSNVSFELPSSGSLALVGESGSGKSSIGSAVQGLLNDNQNVTLEGRVEVAGTKLDFSKPHAWDGVRGKLVTTVFQDPMTSLDPVMSIGKMLHRFIPSKQECLKILKDMRIHDPEAVYRSFPHQLSGGMRQRVIVALALSRHPSVLIADEPTTALDVSVQAQVLALLKEQQHQYHFGMLFITHDLGVARMMVDEAAVMQHGRIAEFGNTESIFNNPRTEYTQRLMSSRITLHTDTTKPIGVPDEAMADSMAETLTDSSRDKLLSRWYDGALLWSDLDTRDIRETTALASSTVKDLPIISHVTRPALAFNDVSKSFRVGNAFRKSIKHVLDHVSFTVGYRESVALVGESGSGKSTILRIASELENADSGGVRSEGSVGEGVQVVFQDAGSSLTPWLSVGSLLEERVKNSGQGHNLSDDAIRQLVVATLGRVGLDPSIMNVKSGNLSGGQRQRIVIARAVVVPPSILLCDEPTSALDVSIACMVLNLIQLIRHSLGISVLFVTHDLAVARYISDRVMVLQNGRIVEEVPSESLQSLKSDYGKELLHAVLP